MIGVRFPLEMGGRVGAVGARRNGAGTGSGRVSSGHITGGIGAQGFVRFFAAAVVFYGRLSKEEKGAVLVKKSEGWHFWGMCV